MGMTTKKKSKLCTQRAAAAPCSSSRGIYLYMCHGLLCFPPSHSSLLPSHPSIHLRQKTQAPLAALLRLPRTVHVRDLGNELGGEDVDLLVGAVQQAQCPNLVGRGRVVSGGFGFLAAVGGLEGCDFGGLHMKFPL
jgi:hypothetical protein